MRSAGAARPTAPRSADPSIPARSPSGPASPSLRAALRRSGRRAVRRWWPRPSRGAGSPSLTHARTAPFGRAYPAPISRRYTRLDRHLTGLTQAAGRPLPSHRTEAPHVDAEHPYHRPPPSSLALILIVALMAGAAAAAVVAFTATGGSAPDRTRVQAPVARRDPWRRTGAGAPRLQVAVARPNPRRRAGAGPDRPPPVTGPRVPGPVATPRRRPPERGSDRTSHRSRRTASSKAAASTLLPAATGLRST